MVSNEPNSVITCDICLPIVDDIDSHSEVTQQSKARHKADFLEAFSPIIAEATSMAYKGANADIQSKLRRVVDVWRERNIFVNEIQDAMEARLDG